ncbi:MAG: type II toxin-antitoxin system mRNA interferase toxin, RelE/StbE family [Nitrospirae bacterium]|nr:type II toxin-antitoxin system mRNA interferase toxin, RelE/StbE family [Nitrospirota bacterium]
MTYQFVRTRQFERALKSFLKKHPDLRDIVVERLILLQKNPQDPRLKTHQLKGNLEGIMAASLTFDYRLVFYIEGSLIYLLNIGSHDEVY